MRMTTFLLAALALAACDRLPEVEPAPQGLPTRALPGGTAGTAMPHEDPGPRIAAPNAPPR